MTPAARRGGARRTRARGSAAGGAAATARTPAPAMIAARVAGEHVGVVAAVVADHDARRRCRSPRARAGRRRARRRPGRRARGSCGSGPAPSAPRRPGGAEGEARRRSGRRGRRAPSGSPASHRAMTRRVRHGSRGRGPGRATPGGAIARSRASVATSAGPSDPAATTSASSADHRLGGLAGLEDFPVAQRHRADAGGEVGHQRDAEDLHAAWRPAMASSAVDMPTRSAPIRLAYCTSAGVS